MLELGEIFMSDETQPADQYSNINRVAVFRKFAEDATKNSHATIKQVWAILFTGGTFALLHSFDALIDCTFTALPPTLPVDYPSIDDHNYCILLHHNWLLFALSLVLFIVYLATFYRFYVGNIRVFDMKYDEVFKFVNNLHDKKNWKNQNGDPPPTTDYQNLLNYSTRLSKPETFQLMINTLVIVYLTVLPLNPPRFLGVYAILLACDLLWMLNKDDGTQLFFRKLFFELFKKPPPELIEEVFPQYAPPPELIEEVFPQYATDRWHENNKFCLLYLLVILGFYGLISYGNYPGGGATFEQFLLCCGAAVALINCYIDLRYTWDFYNPKFSQAHQNVVDNQK